jgi:endoglucanase
MTADERNKVAQLSDYFIDTGLTAEEVKDLVSIGNPITLEREFIEMGNCVNGKSLQLTCLVSDSI